MHLAIDLYFKLLKQVETHLNTAYSVRSRCVRLSQIFYIKTTDRNSRLSCLFTFQFLLQIVLGLKAKSLILI